MEFCCPSCGRVEEIIRDRNPKCMHCGDVMVSAVGYADCWMSPYITIRRMQTISETHGIERARSDGQFKREREAWTTAMFALPLFKLREEEWWIEIETVEQTPDNKLRRLEQSSGRNIIQTREIEVVDWEENVDEIMDVIKKKCQRNYPHNFILLVNARNSGKLLDFDQVIEDVKTLSSPFLEIWIVAAISPNFVKVVRITPGSLAIDLEITKELGRAKNQIPFMKRGTRGTSTELRKLGPMYLPIPRKR